MLNVESSCSPNADVWRVISTVQFPEIRLTSGRTSPISIKKVLRNADDDPSFSDWLYTWIREPERYHKRTRMPNLYLDKYTDVDGTTVIDPAADITAFLLSQGKSEQFQVLEVDGAELDNLVSLYLEKTRFSKSAARGIIESGSFPQKLADVVGDEQALASEDGSAIGDAAVASEEAGVCGSQDDRSLRLLCLPRYAGVRISSTDWCRFAGLGSQGHQ